MTQPELLPSGPCTMRQSASDLLYSPLNNNKNEIRLIYVPSNDDAGVEADYKMITVSMDNTGPYEALSYTWGDSSTIEPILLNGVVVNATENLRAALKILIRRGKGLPIWIDALSINQLDLTERNHQVRKMRTIYKTASRVVISVGALTQRPPIAIKLLHQIHEVIEEKEKVAAILKNPAHNQQLQGVLEILDKPYWSRVWIIQEIYSASSLVLFCGDESIDWTQLRDVQVALEVHHYDLLGEISLNNANLMRLRVAVCQRGAAEFKTDPRGAMQPLTLPQVMLNHRQKKASDGRDMVYSLLGLTTSRDDPRFLLDYSRTISQVYCDLIEHVLDKFHRLDLICAIPRSQTHNEQLPSFVPDWRYSDQSAPYSLLDNRPEYQYSADNFLQAQATIEMKVLKARGFIIAEAGTLGRESNMKNPEDHRQGVLDIHSWRSLLNSLIDRSDDSDLAFGRTMLCDKISQRHMKQHKSTRLGLVACTLGAITRITQKLCPELELDSAMLNYEKESRERWTPAQMWSWSHSTIRRSYRRRFFLTKSQIMGLGPVNMKPSDKICVLFGCQVPVILRQEGARWIYIGEVYVDNYMYGKGIKELNAGNFTEQHFDVH